ncbi:MAG: alpha/beta hydrolase [Clostridia bacterium]|nr:alpha/beta hydrolase [Clostridia bacterium]
MIASLCMFACGEKGGSEPAPAPAPVPDPAPGVETVEITHHGRTVSAEVYRPDASYFPIVIFSHGYNGYKDDFKSSAQYLMENGIGAITFTFCGSGARDTSGFATTDMTLYTEKEDLLAVMDYAKSLKWFDGLFLCGGSQGGMVTAMAAEDRADDLNGVVLLYPAFNIPVDWKAMYPNDNKIPETIPWMGVTLGKNFVLAMRDLDIFEKMPQFSKPVLLFHGTADDLVNISYSEQAAQTYPNAELIVKQGGVHGFLPPNEKLLEFIDDNY